MQVPDTGKDTWEYKVFLKNSAEIIAKLATAQLAGSLADKLRAASIIGDRITKHAHNFGPGVLDDDRVRPMIDALKDQIQQNPGKYHEFRSILLSFGADAETALYYMPEKGKLTLIIMAMWPHSQVMHSLGMHCLGTRCMCKYWQSD